MQRRSSLATYWVAHRMPRKFAELGLENGKLGRGSQWGSGLRSNRVSTLASVPPAPEQGSGCQHHRHHDNYKSHLCHSFQSPHHKHSISPAQVMCPHCICQEVEKSIIWQLPPPVVGSGTLSPSETRILEGLFPNKTVWVLGSQKYGTCPLKIITLKLRLSELSYPCPCLW